MDSYQNLLLQNKNWVTERNQQDHDFFVRMSKSQQPEFLYIGCADSRVHASDITGTDPGEIFVHRNIANMVVHTDMSMLSVLDYAVNILNVGHVIVCGHYGCGGIRAAMGNKQYGLIDNWLRHIKDVYRMHQQELDAIQDSEARENRFVELNVGEQIYDLSKTSIIQNAWATRKRPVLHGWVYDLRSGLIKDLNVDVKDNTEIASYYRFEPPEQENACS